jgi:hypothetical protein
VQAALVTGNAWRHLHTKVGVDTVKVRLITGALRFDRAAKPEAGLDGAVLSDNMVPLFFQQIDEGQFRS